MSIFLLLVLCLALQAAATWGGMNPATAAMFGCVLFLASSAVAFVLSSLPRRQSGPAQQRKKTYITVANMRKKGD